MRIFMTILLVLGLSACTSVSDEHEQDPQPEEELPEQLPEDEGEQEEGDSTEVPQEEPTEDRLAQIQAQIEADFEVKLPSRFKVSDGHYLSATVEADAFYYEVHYYETPNEMAVNDARLMQQEPVALVIGTAYDSKEEAQEQIGDQPIQEGMPEVALTHGITGYQDAGAGSSFLTWHEGRWSFIMRSRNEAQAIEEGTALAKTIVEKLETAMLPPPHEQAVGMFSSGDNDEVEKNRLAWQEENIVYEVYSANPLELIDIVADNFN